MNSDDPCMNCTNANSDKTDGECKDCDYNYLNNNVIDKGYKNERK